ncbi:hypothetical protein [Sporosarcina sp. Te-1]|uniref:hypothetical protein n=1 Tax=Sporosarcina sp. Te-1 TaxID=2818390 RepID=UPI001A9E2F10|nr:hypothetical protein [Sporosarcina sp. Te-1]QTD41570.1 hypothetical protein J3U78_01530 [Sporosarcina sp. Te-1]
MSKNNENGYALLIVLLLIVLILSLTAVFFRGSLSNAKQEMIVDENHLTVMAAESGVDYIKSELSNEFYGKREELDNFIKQEIKTAGEKNKLNYDSIQIVATKKLEGYLSEILIQEKSRAPRKIESYYRHQLVDYKIEANKTVGVISITGSVAGLYENGEVKKEKSITFNQIFKVPNYNPLLSESSGSNIDVPNMYKLYPDNVKASACKSKNEGKIEEQTCSGDRNANYKDIEDSTVYFPDGFNKSTGNLEVEESKIYAKGDFRVNNFNDLEDSLFLLDGSFSAKNMNEIEDSTMMVNGNMTIESNMELEESSLIVRGATHIKGHLTVKDKSRVCISGSLTVDKHLTIEDQSILYIWGSYVVHNKLKGTIKTISSEQELWDKCKVGAGAENGPVWSKPVIDHIKYN